jgi:recombination protein RecA
MGGKRAGKTTFGVRGLARAQRMFPDQRVALIDAEGTYDPIWGATHGIDNEDMLLVQPETGEQALDIANGLLRSADISMVMVDSLPRWSRPRNKRRALKTISWRCRRG